MKVILIMLAVAGVLDATIGIMLNAHECALPVLAGMAIGAGLQAGSNAIGMGLQGAQGKKSQERQFGYNSQMLGLQTEASKQLMAEQMKYNKEMYDYSYEKENYKSQVEQMKRAGLNPGLMYGGVPGLGGQTASTGATTSGQGVSGYSVDNPGANIAAMGIGTANMLADIELKKSQANLNNVEAKKKEGVDTQEAQSRIELLAQQTNNVQLKNVYQNLDNAMKELELKVADVTNEELINTTIANYQKAQEEAYQAYLKSGVNQATQTDEILQMKYATQSAYLDMLSKKLGIQLTSEQITKVQAEIDKIVNDVDVSKREIAVKEALQKFQTSDLQEYKLMSEIFRNGAQGIEQLGSLFKKGTTVNKTYNNQKINSETIINE